MKILLSYGDDSNESLMENIKEYLSKDMAENLKYEAWIDTAEIKADKLSITQCVVNCEPNLPVI